MTLRLLIAWFGLYVALGAGQQPPGVGLRFAAPARVGLGEPVIVDLSFQNTLNEPVIADMGLNSVSNFEVDVRRPDGNRALVRPMPPGIASEGRIDLPPKSTSSRVLVLSEWLNMREVGVYGLEIRFKGAVETRAGSVANDVERTWKGQIIVDPRDEQVIRTRCEALLRVVRQGDDWTPRDANREAAIEAQRAARMLAYFQDKAAVPYILEVALHVSLPLEQIESLVRIGGYEARGALAQLVASTSGITADYARAGLARIK